MKILMPKKFDLENSLNFCKELDKIEESDEYIYDYSEMGSIEPFGMLIIGSKIRKFVEMKNLSEHSDCNFDTKEYAGHMGYFRSTYLEFGKKPGEACGNNNYIPITCINIKESYSNLYDNGYTDIYDYIDDIARELANVISRGDRLIKKHLTYCISELIRNVYEHSKSEKLWYAAQYWPSKDIVEISILDEGEGVLKTLKRNKKIKLGNDKEALMLSVEPGITKSILRKQNSYYSETTNQGFGLYMTKNICGKYGSFVICSGDSALLYKNGDTKIIETSFSGTAVRMQLKVSKLNEAQKLIRDLSVNGTKKSNELNKLRTISVDLLDNL